MTARWLILLLVAAAARAASVETTAPVKEFTLPAFTPEGYRTMLLRAGEARFPGPRQVDLTNMQLTWYAGDASNRVDTILVSPAASLFRDRNVVQGERGVRLLRDDAEMSGQKWSYDRPQRKVVLDGDVHVIFRAALKDLLR